MKLIQICALAGFMAAAAVAQNATPSRPAAAPSPMPKAVQKAAPAHVKPGMHKPVAAVAKKTSSNSAAKTGSTNKVQASQKAVPVKTQPMAKVKNPPVKAGVLPEKKGQKALMAKPVTAKPATAAAHKAAPPIRVLPVKPKTPSKSGAVGASSASRKSTNKTATRPPEPAPKPTLTAAGPSIAEKKPAPRLIGSAGRRDPFVSPIRSAGAVSSTQSCTSGKRCLAIPELILQGTVRDITGKMMAVVSTSNRRTYTLRENDQVFNGSVEKITSDSIIFRQYVKDALGRESAKEIVKKMGPTT
ncbi:MAG TPA: hypothetical protein VN669_14840 [Candidatus Acidoferrales bacterium]|jgi:hypothetical protein|nr:hypothetical protein [Candidatus Acidoferrales bacterium]